MTKINQLVDLVSSESTFFNHEECPFKINFTKGTAKVLVIVGDNASGKSLFSQFLTSWGSRSNMSPACVSIRERTGAGLNEMASMRRAFMYGDETEQSTGATTVGVIKSGFSSVRSYSVEGKDGLLLLDEPELGLSDSYVMALGKYIVQETMSLPENAAGVIVVSHSKSLISSITTELRILGLEPGFVYMGSQPKNIDEWIAEAESKTIDELLLLKKKDTSLFAITNRLLHEIKKKKS